MNHHIYKILIIIISFPIITYPISDTTLIFNDICPFECCQLGEWVVEDEINVYQNEGDTNSILFQLNGNDTIFAETGNLHFLRVGKVVVIKQIYNFQPGDTLIVYNCSEGEFLASHKSKEYYIDIFWPMFFSEEEDTEENYLLAISKGEYFGKMIQTPRTVWWVKIESPKGQGWLRLENKTPYCFRINGRIKGMDGCS